ncbi:MAG TPA: adenylate/guanylate cyclase domain-containing protein [Anaerolineales bacterium]|nr:adenylate/guanylate cyclase domain-containing protein [Anaerolineales bacterium]
MARIGIDPNDSDDVRLQKNSLVLGSGMFIFAGALWGILYFLLGHPVAGAIPFSYAVISFLSMVVFHLTRRYRLFLYSQLLLILFLPFLLMIALGGFVRSSGVILWALLSPLGALLFDESRYALSWLAAYLGLVIFSGFLEYRPLVSSSLSPALVTLFFVMNIGAVSSIVITLLAYFVKEKNRLFGLLRMEQEKSENLLLNILPKDIATRLKRGEEQIVDNYESVSILFVDLVDFTPLSATCDPKAMLAFLSDIFSYFDQLVEKYAVAKIETVGDSYVVAAGLPTPCENHAAVVTSLALEIQAYFESGVFLEGQPVHCRMGINSGPIMAGVIERKKISYNVWGDTVNTASRMQSHGIPGQIQVSEFTHRLIKDEFVCEPRGTVHVKGKGDMRVWLVLSTK